MQKLNSILIEGKVVTEPQNRRFQIASQYREKENTPIDHTYDVMGREKLMKKISEYLSIDREVRVVGNLGPDGEIIAEHIEIKPFPKHPKQ